MTVEQIANINCFVFDRLAGWQDSSQVRLLMVHRFFASNNDFPLLPDQGEARIGSLSGQFGKWMIGNTWFKLLSLCFLAVRLKCFCCITVLCIIQHDYLREFTIGTLLLNGFTSSSTLERLEANLPFVVEIKSKRKQVFTLMKIGSCQEDLVRPN